MDNKLIHVTNAVKHISTLEDVDIPVAFEKLIDWCAVYLGIDGASSRLKIKTSEWLHETFDIMGLKNDPWDWFGETMEFFDIIEQKLPRKEELNAQLSSMARSDNANWPRTVLFKSVTTGRGLILMHAKYGNEMVYFGVEKDKLLYRTSVLNCKLYDIPSFILYSSEPGKKLCTSSKNWQFANAWVPVGQKWIK